MAKHTSSKAPPGKPVRPKAGVGRWLAGFVVIVGGLVASGALLVGLAVALAWPNLPNLNALIDYRPKVPLRVYTADNVQIGEFGEERRRVVPINEVPDILKAAILAAEDDHFYQHGGIDWQGVARAVLANLRTMSKAQGASTITMQVARNFYLSSEKTWSRKFYELLLTFKIEANLTKDQILELYINQIYLGQRAYGFEAAARVYFGKTLSELTLAEAALLAGIPQAPSRFNPITNLPRAQVRERYVLRRLLELGYITHSEYEQALAQPIVLRPQLQRDKPNFHEHGKYVAELARQLMYDIYKEETYTRGLNVYTTVTSRDLELAWKAVREGTLAYDRRRGWRGPEAFVSLPEGIEHSPEALDDAIDAALRAHPDSGDLLAAVVLSASPDKVVVARSSGEVITITGKQLAFAKPGLAPKAQPSRQIRRGAIVRIRQVQDGAWEILQLPEVQAAFVAISPVDGAIKTLVGGFDFDLGKFNRVTQAWRQPGSAFKPFIYAAALERGITPLTRISDQPFVLEADQTGGQRWTPKNYGNNYEYALTLREGLAKSKNMVSIRVLQAIGPEYAQDYITRFGFDAARHPPYLTMALGAGSVTPLQLAGAYAVFANGGYRVVPYLINKVTNNQGQLLMQARPVLAGDESARVIDARTAFVTDSLLRNNVATGTAQRAASLKRKDVAGKTGTTNDSIDAWFAGYADSIVGVAWMGYDQPRSLGDRETGGGVALPIWLDYMKEALKDAPERVHPMPPGLIEAGGTYYFAEFPPGKAVASIGLDEDPVRDLIDSLGGAGPVAADSTPPPIEVRTRQFRVGEGPNASGITERTARPPAPRESRSPWSWREGILP